MVTFSRFATEESLSVEDVREMIERGKIVPTELLSRDGSSEWRRANEFDELRRFFETAPPHRPAAPHVLTTAEFEPKFSEREPSSALPLQFAGAFLLLVAFIIFGSGIGSFGELMIFVLFVIAGLACLAIPGKLQQLSQRELFANSPDALQKIIAFGVIGLVAIVFLFAGAHAVFREARSIRWPATQAIVTRTWSDNDGTRGFSYAFEIGRAKYRGRTYGEAFTGQPVRVRYNPADPSDSVLDGIRFQTVAPLLMAVVGIIVVTGYLARRKRT